MVNRKHSSVCRFSKEKLQLPSLFTFLKAKDKENLSKSVYDKQLSTCTLESFPLNFNYKLWDKIVNYKLWDKIVNYKCGIKLDRLPCAENVSQEYKKTEEIFKIEVYKLHVSTKRRNVTE